MFNFVKPCFYYLIDLEKYVFHRIREREWGKAREAEKLEEEWRIEREKGNKEGVNKKES